MKKQLTIVVLLILSITITACNKEKRYSTKLMKGQKWEVTSLTVAGNSLNTLGVWYIIQNINIYDEVPKVSWSNTTSNTTFDWQFQSKGETFQLNYNHNPVECDSSTLSTLDYVAYDLTGTYSVIEHSRKKMEFTSTETIKYPGQKVQIFIERIK